MDTKVIKLFKGAIKGLTNDDEETKTELEEKEDDDFEIIDKTGLFDVIKKNREAISNALFAGDFGIDLVEKLRKLLYWED